MSDLLLSRLTTLAQNSGPALDWFTKRMSGLPKAPVEPKTLPHCSLLPNALALTSDATKPVIQALVEASDTLFWQQTYSEADGFSRDWLNAYGWINLISPEGLYLSDDIRVSIGYWGAGQRYPDHAHEPEEVYLVLAGSACFHAENRPSIQAKPGDLVHHAPNQIHAIDMTPGPLVAAAFWRGDHLLAKSDLK